MEWNRMYGPDREPSLEEIGLYVVSPLWEDLNRHVQETYKTSPKRAYSKCSGAPGWNVKYQKSGKSLCTLYPDEGRFTALVVIGNKETPETELLLPSLGAEVRELYERVPFACGGKWLMITVDSGDVLRDVKKLIGIRAAAK